MSCKEEDAYQDAVGRQLVNVQFHLVCLNDFSFTPVLFRYLPSMQGMRQTFPNTSMDSVSETA